jgi:hypothetical protein
MQSHVEFYLKPPSTNKSRCDIREMTDDAMEDEQPTNVESRLEVFQYLNDGCWLADVVHKETQDTNTVQEFDSPAFFVEDNPYFDYPEPRLLNQMIKDGFLSVHVSPWVDGGRENPHYNLRHFRLTEKGKAMMDIGASKL